MLQMSQRDRDRLVVIRQVSEGRLSVTRGGQLLRLGRKQMGRLRDRYLEEGDAAVISRHRGRRPNNAKPETLKAAALERARRPIFRDFGATLLSEHLERDPEIGWIHPATLRLWLIEAGIRTVRRRGQRHRKARLRRAAIGELVQMDGSDHAWFEDRHRGRLTLLKMVDDATNRLLMARFVERENGPACRQLIIDYLKQYGRPVAIYADKAGHFGQQTRPHTPNLELEERDPVATESIIRRGLEALNIGLILAHSPQAKGRVERDFGTSQDRLVKELRVAGIETMEAGNTFLEEVYMPFWNERFAVPPAVSRDAHRRLPARSDLERLFAETWTRSVAKDFTIRWKHRRLQIPKHQARGLRPKAKIIVEHRLDGSTRFRFDNRYLDLEPVAERPPQKPKTPPAPHLHSLPPRPGPNHPWLKNGSLLAKPALIARLRSTPAASRPALSTP